MSLPEVCVFFRFGARFGFMYALLLQVKARGHNYAEEGNLQIRLDALRFNILSRIVIDPVVIDAVLQQLNTEIDVLYQRD